MMRTALCFMTFMASLVLGLDAPIPGYTVVDLVWSVDAFGNGTMVNITGPVEKVYDELKRINSTMVEAISLAKSSPNTDEIVLPYTRCIDGASGGANGQAIKRGIRYLRRLYGWPTNGPGPNACGRVSCSWKSAIWWCNDNNYAKTLAAFFLIADCAEKVLDECPWYSGFVGGQRFRRGNWSCIVRRDEDNC